LPIYSKTATAKSDFILKHLLQAELPAKDHGSAKKIVTRI